MSYRGRHRAPTRRALTAARIAVGGLALAEITGGFSVPAAWAEETPPPAVCGAQAQSAARVASAGAQKAADQQQAAQQAGQQHAAPAPLHDHYIVQPGDNLTYIAAQYGISWDALWPLNTDIVGDNPDLIFPGQRLRLPA